MSVFRGILVFLLVLFAVFQQTLAIVPKEKWITVQGPDGKKIPLRDSRKPALYTGDFGDCMGSSSLVKVTRFDAAFYKDNMTVVFHLQGSTTLAKEAVMMYIGVSAYGETRFQLPFNPCSANIRSACPLSKSIPIEARGNILVAPEDIANIPDIALTIPDFEGRAIFQIFANSTKSEIGCISAVVTNGATFSHPYAVGSLLGVFATIAIVSSFATAIYGHNVPEMRKHYAHSMSVLVVFAVFQHIYYTGALSLNLPSVLVAFWSNYAWAGGMIFTKSMQSSINRLVGEDKGNPMAVGASGTGFRIENLAGKYDLRKIYKRDADDSTHMWATRALLTEANGFSRYGKAANAGLPLPGNYSGFAGTLSFENIPASNAFMTGFLWLLTAVVIIGSSVALFKWTLEGMMRVNLVKGHRLGFFRKNWQFYTQAAVLRTLFIGFFMIIFLTTFQFTYHGASAVIGISTTVFLLFFIGGFTLAGYAGYYRMKRGTWTFGKEVFCVGKGRVLKIMPWWTISRDSVSHSEGERGTIHFCVPVIKYTPNEDGITVHEDIDYMTRFGWLVSRYRRSQWLFFCYWLAYEFVRATLYGGASGHPMVQVFGLLAVETLAFCGIIYANPYESRRLNALVVYLLGFSKVATLALAATFHTPFALPRIPATAIGIVIIVLHSLLTLFLLVAIAISAATSWMSIMRDRPTEDFHPQRWRRLREKYFAYLARAGSTPSEEDAQEKSPSISVESLLFWRKRPNASRLASESTTSTVAPVTGFRVSSVRRIAKIEDEDPDIRSERALSAADFHADPVLVNPAADEDETTRAPSSVAQSVSPNMSPERIAIPRRPRLERIDTGVEWDGTPADAASRPRSDASVDSGSSGSRSPGVSEGGASGLTVARVRRSRSDGSTSVSRSESSGTRSASGGLSYGSLPRGAVPHKASWSMRELGGGGIGVERSGSVDK
ncbi:TRP-domain-containing protein [Eremomyces bilateralis CBS 781.70]|uniref:TRP-domain-containing protein n=1 Tax=Eremomyces bilateralis CBS 781.70 TaxID=1392243 RepID=A0A6G1FQY5_9PEZI|nr:TRP-domain-containing protein [Eremomyces bilateralis CBS 781.70]KAF1808245.1 TRP-domain-containing protein [Eremomyces bilateralis CBS 781.70]